jgi:hypothetical protein
VLLDDLTYDEGKGGDMEFRLTDEGEFLASNVWRDEKAARKAVI